MKTSMSLQLLIFTMNKLKVLENNVCKNLAIMSLTFEQTYPHPLIYPYPHLPPLNPPFLLTLHLSIYHFTQSFRSFNHQPRWKTFLLKKREKKLFYQKKRVHVENTSIASSSQAKHVPCLSLLLGIENEETKIMPPFVEAHETNNFFFKFKRFSLYIGIGLGGMELRKN